MDAPVPSSQQPCTNWERPSLLKKTSVDDANVGKDEKRSIEKNT